MYSGEAAKCILLEACLEYALLSLVLSKDRKFQRQLFYKCLDVTLDLTTSTTMLYCCSYYYYYVLYLQTVPEDPRQKPACHWRSCWRDRRDTGI